jgi:hypothetical protein
MPGADENRFVIAGLDPATLCRLEKDARVKPGHDATAGDACPSPADRFIEYSSMPLRICA